MESGTGLFGEVTRTISTSCQSSTASPLMAAITSPRFRPAFSAGEPSSTPPMTGGISGRFMTSIPTMKRAVKSAIARSTFISGPAR